MTPLSPRPIGALGARVEIREQLIMFIELLEETQIYARVMSTALGNDECTIPYDDDLDARITKALIPYRSTCYNCVDNHDCRSAFDPYNTNGDCLEDK